MVVGVEGGWEMGMERVVGVEGGGVGGDGVGNSFSLNIQRVDICGAFCYTGSPWYEKTFPGWAKFFNWLALLLRTNFC